MAPEAYRYALPKDLYEDLGVRRYGFHGTSYSFVLKEVARALGKPQGRKRVRNSQLQRLISRSFSTRFG